MPYRQRRHPPTLPTKVGKAKHVAREAGQPPAAGTNGIVNVVRATIPVSVHNLRHGRGHFCHTSSTKRIGSGGDRRHDWVSISPTSGTETYNSSHHVSITARITSPDEIGHACLRIMAH
jgi:hypothetical protein